MQKINFKDFKTHQLMHKTLLSTFETKRKEFFTGSAQTLPQSFFDFLKMWLSSHIKGVDVKYGHGH